MNWARIAFGVSDILSIILVVRLFSLRLHLIYRVFCAFLLFEIASEWFVVVERFTSLGHFIDYRVAWLLMRLVSWILSLWMVYALLQDILVELPGILRISRRVLTVVIPLSLLVALVSAGPEYVASGAIRQPSSLAYLVSVALIMERLVATIALLSLLLMLAFILWFPVTLPRNLVLFSIGFAVYFCAKTTLLLAHSFWTHGTTKVMDIGVTLILCICLLYWITFLNERSEHVSLTLGHRWEATKQAKLVNDLDHLNAVLARAGRR